MDVTALNGRAYAKFVIAGSYFLRKYRQVLNDLNVFPVPDGDTGTNMYLTVRQAAREAAKVQHQSLAEVAAAAAQGSLMGARGNSGVIISQMLRGFAHHVRHRSEIDTFMFATGMREAVTAARQALVKPVEGTILSVAHAAAEAAYKLALHEPDFYRLTSAVVRAANEALDRTPEQLPALKEAGVVDSGGAGFVYFLEGGLRFLPDVKTRATAFPRRPVRRRVFHAAQAVGERKFCTEFILERATASVATVRELLASEGDSLIVAGEQPTIKVHLHTADPDAVTRLVSKHGEPTHVKVEDMERQHNLLLIEAPAAARSIVAVVPGPGFAEIARELGAEAVVETVNPSVRDLLLAVNSCLGSVVYLLPNDKNAVLAAKEAAALSERTVHVIPTRDMVGGVAALFALRSAGADALPEPQALAAAAEQPRSAQVFLAGKDATVGGTSLQRGKPAAAFGEAFFAGTTPADAAKSALETMGARDGGLITLYYGGTQKQRDAQRMCEEMSAAFPRAEVDYYYGGQPAVEYWISLDE